MKNNALAANALTLPAEGHPDRRTLLTSGAAAALIASTAHALPAADPDAELLALRPQWLAIRAAMAADHDPRTPADLPRYRAIMAAMPCITDAVDIDDLERIRDRQRELRRQIPEGIREPKAEEKAREDRLQAMCNAEDRIIAALTAQPARTARGLAFKAEVFMTDDVVSKELALSVAIDAMRLGGASTSTAA